jgi:serine/threonine protein kinase
MNIDPPDSSIDRASALPPGSMLGAYRIVRLLGGGGMGDVYEAEDLTLRRRVAIKRLRRDVSDRDQRQQLLEAILDRGGHPAFRESDCGGSDDGTCLLRWPIAISFKEPKRTSVPNATTTRCGRIAATASVMVTTSSAGGGTTRSPSGFRRDDLRRPALDTLMLLAWSWRANDRVRRAAAESGIACPIDLHPALPHTCAT